MLRLARFLALSVIVCACVLTFVGAHPGRVYASSAQKEPLEHDIEASCFSGPPPGPHGHGFVTINENRSGTLIAAVALKHALPNTTYQVALTQTPSGFGCNIYTATLTTDARGDGKAHLTQPEQSGTTGAFVDVFYQPSSDFYNSLDAPV